MSRCANELATKRRISLCCVKPEGHVDPCLDPNGAMWRHPSRPYGVRRNANSNGARGPTKHGSYLSDMPARYGADSYWSPIGPVSLSTIRQARSGE